MFILLEILEPGVNHLIRGIKDIVSGSEHLRPIHITLRGPYKSIIRSHRLDKLEQTLSTSPIYICGVGRFKNKDEEVVFFRVSGENIRKVWWKPDFTIRRHGFQPHISVYRGKDTHFANVLESFLKHENIELTCSKYKLTVRQSKQLELFQRSPDQPSDLLQLFAAGLVSETILVRLRDLVENYSAKRHSR